MRTRRETPRDVIWQGRTVHTGICRSRGRAWRAGSTSTGMDKGTWAAAAVNGAPSMSISSIPIVSHGVGHNCETGLVAGLIGYHPDPVDAPADGNVLICCARPEGDVVIDL
jgi:hypothetical protein